MKKDQEKKMLRSVKAIAKKILHKARWILPIWDTAHSIQAPRYFGSEAAIVAKSIFFDQDYYLANNADVALAGIDAAEHYAGNGWKEGRAPARNFNSHFIRTYVGNIPADANPVVFIEQLKDSDRDRYNRICGNFKKFAEDYAIVSSSSYFDPEFYIKKYDDLQIQGIDPALHYLIHGYKEHRIPSQKFNLIKWLENHPYCSINGGGVEITLL